MNKIRRNINLFWWIPVAVLIIMGIVFGTSFDLSISKSLYKEGSYFSLIFTLIGSLPAFVLLGFTGPLLSAFFAAKSFKNSKILAKVAFFLCPIIAGFGYGYDILNDMMAFFLAIPLGIIVVLGLTLLLYIPFKNIDPENGLRDALVIGLSIGGAIIIGLLGKEIFTRPRYMFILEDETLFTPWFKVIGKEYPTLAESQLDSFPSGHATLAGTLLLLPLLSRYNEKTENYGWIFYLVPALWIILTALARIIGGYHYLSDVSFGALIGSGMAFLMNLLIKEPETQENNG